MFRVFLLCLVLGTASARAEFSREYLDQLPLLTTPANDISIAYRSLGSQERTAVVMIMGLGASHVVWGDDMVRGIETAGYRVILLDNRDVGGSTRFDDWGQPTFWWQLLKRELGLEVDAPYSLNDMAADTVALMDVLEVTDAHFIGASMGGMIAQVVAAKYPERTRSLVSIMSTTGDPDLPPPTAEAAEALQGTANDDESSTERRASMVARGFYPDSMGRQMMGVFKTGDRSAEVATIASPTLVIHGADDPLLPSAHGKHTAQLISGSELVIYEGMGHNIPEEILPALQRKMIEHMQAVDLELKQ
ncbi:MAG: pimeloyl-ACP methyl ester carboxylesterase [Halioglobus sp.]|jgi:pimeloyl-ACP methyl ester carboxylesterase